MADEELAVEEEEQEEESPQRGGKKKKKAAKKKASKKDAKDEAGGEEEDEHIEELKDCLKKKGKWMFCTVVMAGTNVVFTLDPKKAITKDKQNAMKGTMKGKKTVFIGACKTGNPLNFRLVTKKGAKLPAPLRKYLKGWVNQQTGKNYKVDVGEPLEEMPKKLSEIDEMDKQAKKK